MDKEIIISDSLDEVARMQRDGYITHAWCSGGECGFVMDGQAFCFAKGDCLIVPHQELEFAVGQKSEDFVVEVVYVSFRFIQTSTPQSNYGIRGHLALFENPVMHLRPEQQRVCALNFDYIRRRLAVETHRSHHRQHLHRGPRPQRQGAQSLRHQRRQYRRWFLQRPQESLSVVRLGRKTADELRIEN